MKDKAERISRTESSKMLNATKNLRWKKGGNENNGYSN